MEFEFSKEAITFIPTESEHDVMRPAVKKRLINAATSTLPLDTAEAQTLLWYVDATEDGTTLNVNCRPSQLPYFIAAIQEALPDLDAEQLQIATNMADKMRTAHKGFTALLAVIEIPEYLPEGFNKP